MRDNSHSAFSILISNQWVRLFVLFSIFILSLLLIIYLKSILFPLILAFVIAYILDPLADKLTKRFFPRWLVSALLVILLIVIFVLFIIVFMPSLFEELINFFKSIPDYVEKIKVLLEPHFKKLHDKYPIEVDNIIKNITTEVEKKLPTIAQNVTDIFFNTFSNLLAFILGLLKLIFIPIFTFFILKDIDNIKKWIKIHLPVRYRERILSITSEIDDVLGSYLRGQLFICLIVGSYYSVAFVLIGVPFGLLFGILIGTVNFVPYMGVFVGVIPALILTLAETGSFSKVLIIALVYLAQQIWDGMYLTPSILGKKVGLHPVFILLSLMIFGKLFGIIGILIAVPSAAIIKVFLKRWLESYRLSQLQLEKAYSKKKAK